MRRAKEDLAIAKAARKVAAVRPAPSSEAEKPASASRPIDFCDFGVEEVAFSELCEASASMFRSVGGELFRKAGVHQVPPHRQPQKRRAF